MEEAVEVLMISSDEEEPDQDAHQPQHPSQAPGKPWCHPESYLSECKPSSGARSEWLIDN